MALVVPAACVLILAWLAGRRTPVQADRAVLAAALYSLGAWIAYRLALALARGRWKEIVLAAASLAAATGMAEAALRRLRPYDSLCRFRWNASSRYHHVNPPGRRMLSGYVEGTPIVVETNEDGLRTGHSRESFQRHAVRIAILGDSFVFGSGVNAEAAFPAVLERRLRSRAATRDAAVLNAGVISYSPLLERRLFDGVVAAYRPALVLLFLDVTDIGDDAIYARKLRPDGTFALEGEDRFACYGAVHQVLSPCLGWLGAQLRYPVGVVATALGHPPRPAGNYYADPIIFQGSPENRYFIYRHPLAQTRPYYENTLREVEGLAASAARQGAAFALVVFPRYHHWSTRECRQNWELRAYGENEPFQYEHFRFFDEAAAREPFPIHDLLPDFKATWEYPLVFPNDPHWNARGHDFVARRIEDYLIGRKLLP